MSKSDIRSKVSVTYNPRSEWTNSVSPLPQVTLRLDQLKEARDSAQSLMIKAQKSWVKHRDTPKYNVGDQVWLEGKNLRINQPTHKLAPRRYGPFKVTQVMSPVNYRLELPTQWSIHPVFHIDLLTPYRETITHGANYQRPPPDLVNNKEEYEVETVLDSRKFGRRRCLQYLIKWKGYPDSNNQWIDKDDVSADDKVWEFKTSNPAKEVHIRGAFDAHSSHPPHSQLFTFIDQYMSQSSNDFSEVLEYANTVFAPQGDTPPATRHLRRLIDLADHAIADALEERLGRLSLTLQSSQHPNMPKKVLKFTDPNPHSVGMITAIAWRREQLQRARERWDQHNAQRIKEGHLPMTYHSHALRDCATSAMDQPNIATDTTPQNHSQSDRENCLEAQLLSPPHPHAWSRLKAEVASPSPWLGTSSTLSSNTTTCWKTTPPLSGKTTKIPLRFRRPTLPKGWKYEEDVVEEEAEVIKREEEDQFAFSTSRRSNRRRSITAGDGRESRAHPYLKTGQYLRRDTSTTGDPHTFPSTSTTTTGAKSQRALSKSTCKARTHMRSAE